MENIKRLSRVNYDEIFKLSQFAFQYSLNEEQLKKKEEEAERHNIWGYTVDEKLAGKLHIIPLHIYINGKTFQMGGISSVATWPEYRRQGIAKKLLFHALQEMKKAGQTISLLHPFHVGFYRKYGWELAFSNKNYTIPMEKLKQKWNGIGYIKRTDRDIPLLHSIYTTYAKKYNGMLTRDEKWWEQRVLTDEDVQIAIAYNEQDQAEGYMIYKVRGDIVRIQEIAYETTNGMHVLYQFISNHDSMAKSVEMKVSENDLLPYMLEDPTFKQELEPYFMVRIVDAFEFLKQYRFTEVDGVVHVHIEDDFLPENNGTYQIRTENGQTTVTKTTSHQVEDMDIQCSVQQLASICLGYKRPPALYEQGFINGDKEVITQLDKMIPQRQTYVTDFF